MIYQENIQKASKRSQQKPFERRKWSQEAVLMNAAKRNMRLAIRDRVGPELISSAAFAGASVAADRKFNLTKVPADIKAKLEEMVKAALTQ